MGYKYFIGIDQSVTNTGVVVLDHDNKKVIEIVNIKGKSFKPFFEVGSDVHSQNLKRVFSIVTEIKDVLSKYFGTNSCVCVERLTSGNKSKNTDYLLGYLFYSIIGVVDSYYFDRIVVAPLSHKQLFFPAKISRFKKKELHKKFFYPCFEETGYEVQPELSLNNDDVKDAFCLAYFGEVRNQYKLTEVFKPRKTKEKNTKEGRILESIKGNICEELRVSKRCWECVAYDYCTKKGKYEGPSKLTKKQEKIKKELREKTKQFIEEEEGAVFKELNNGGL